MKLDCHEEEEEEDKVSLLMIGVAEKEDVETFSDKEDGFLCT